MSKIKGYTPEEDCNSKGKAIKEDWNKVERELDRLYEEQSEIGRMILVQKDLIKELRKKEAENVIQYVRYRLKKLSFQKVDVLLCHCQNMLNGNIDNTVLKFSEDDLEKENKKMTNEFKDKLQHIDTWRTKGKNFWVEIKHWFDPIPVYLDYKPEHHWTLYVKIFPKHPLAQKAAQA